MEALGKGFDLTSDFRLRFAKGSQRLVVLDEVNKRDLLIPSTGVTIKAVSQDIRVDKGDRIRFKSDVLEFNQVFLFILFFHLLFTYTHTHTHKEFMFAVILLFLCRCLKY